VLGRGKAPEQQLKILLAENIRLKSENSMLTDRLNIVEQQAVMIAIEKVKEMREQMLKTETLRFHTAIRLIAEESGAASDEVRRIRRLEAGYVLLFVSCMQSYAGTRRSSSSRARVEQVDGAD
jgi:regulator of replication initiation timing